MRISTIINHIKKFVTENKIETIVILFLLVTSTFLRFHQLGYSSFYGDETKALYWNKGIPASKFFLEQRKGPVQFLVAWFTEKASGGFEEGTLRLPFAFASLLSVFVMYIFLRRRYGYEAAFLGSFTFSLLGFYIAFGRTVQYQSFLVLFGLLSILFVDIGIEKKRSLWLILAGVFLGLSFLSHYDAVFFAVPTAFLLIGNFKDNFKKLVPFLVPFLILVSAFYLPYIIGGYMKEEVGGYLYRRFTGFGLSEYSSLYTFVTYNPSAIWAIVFLFSFYGFIKASREDKKLYLIWFLIPFVLFEFAFSRPGTHIHNYIIPLIILFSISVSSHKLLKYLFGIVLVVLLVVNIKIFIPRYSTGYPWGESSRDEYQLFIYGFPYNRGWDQIAEYLIGQGVRTFYTNDNITIGEWYLLGVPADPSSPHYFISVENNQEFKDSYSGDTIDYVEISGMSEAHREYQLVKQIFVEGKRTANIYKRVVPVE